VKPKRIKAWASSAQLSSPFSKSTGAYCGYEAGLIEAIWVRVRAVASVKQSLAETSHVVFLAATKNTQPSLTQTFQYEKEFSNCKDSTQHDTSTMTDGDTKHSQVTGHFHVVTLNLRIST